MPAKINRDEVTVTDPATGGKKNQKLAQVGALDPGAILAVAEVAGFGATKYARYNFLKGYDWSLSYDAMQRHLMLWYSGEDVDPETGMSHLAHATWHGLALLAFEQRGLGTDNRPTDEVIA
jgi:hypothetical protein